ncbi:MAG: hypothetical protein WDN49_06545 [Acetobacteraceae bacterium]
MPESAISAGPDASSGAGCHLTSNAYSVSNTFSVMVLTRSTALTVGSSPGGSKMQAMFSAPGAGAALARGSGMAAATAVDARSDLRVSVSNATSNLRQGLRGRTGRLR